MPVKNVFERDAVPAGFTYNQITDFNSLSFSDPNSLLSSYSVVGGLHTLNLNTIAVGNADYNFGTGPNFTGIRWYFPLSYADGSIVQAGDTFAFTTKVTNLASPDTARTWHIAVGCVQNATSTLTNTMDPLATTFGITSVNTTLVGTLRRSTAGTVSLANIVNAYGQSLFGGLPGKTKVGAQVTGQSASTATVTNGLDANSWTVADASQVYGIIMVGSLGTAATTGGTISFKLFYNVSKLS